MQIVFEKGHIRDPRYYVYRSSYRYSWLFFDGFIESWWIEDNNNKDTQVVDRKKANRHIKTDRM